MKLTTKILKRIIDEEVAKFGDERDVEKEAGKTDEVDADEYADTVDKHIDFMKALKIRESRLQARLKKIQETRRRVARQIARS